MGARFVGTAPGFPHPIALAAVEHALCGISEGMPATLIRTAYYRGAAGLLLGGVRRRRRARGPGGEHPRAPWGHAVFRVQEGEPGEGSLTPDGKETRLAGKGTLEVPPGGALSWCGSRGA